MFKVSYHVVSCVTGCMKCLATVGPTFGTMFVTVCGKNFDHKKISKKLSKRMSKGMLKRILKRTL